MLAAPDADDTSSNIPIPAIIFPSGAPELPSFCPTLTIRQLGRTGVTRTTERPGMDATRASRADLDARVQHSQESLAELS